MAFNPYKLKWMAKLTLSLLTPLLLVTFVLLLPGIIVLFFFYRGYRAILQDLDQKMKQVFSDEKPLDSLDSISHSDPGSIEEVINFLYKTVPTQLYSTPFTTVIGYTYYIGNRNDLVFDLLCRTIQWNPSYEKISIGCDTALSKALWDRMNGVWMGRHYEEDEMPMLPEICIAFYSPDTQTLGYIKFKDDNCQASIYYS